MQNWNRLPIIIRTATSGAAEGTAHCHYFDRLIDAYDFCAWLGAHSIPFSLEIRC